MADIGFLFTPVPKWYFAVARDLKHSENLILLYCLNAAFGTPEAREQDYLDLSYSNLQAETGLSRASVARAISGLREKNLINQHISTVKAQRIRILHPQIEISGLKYEPLKQDVESQNCDVGVSNMNHSSYINKKNQEDDDSSLEKWFLGFGFSKNISHNLALIASQNQRDTAYLNGLSGYVTSNAQIRNKRAYLRRLVENNDDVPQSRSNGSTARLKPNDDAARKMDKWKKLVGGESSGR